MKNIIYSEDRECSDDYESVLNQLKTLLEKNDRFLESGTDVNTSDSNQITALMTAYYRGQLDVVKYLVENVLILMLIKLSTDTQF